MAATGEAPHDTRADGPVRLREITEGPVRDLPTPEETLKAEAKAKVNRAKAAKGRAGQLRRT